MKKLHAMSLVLLLFLAGCAGRTQPPVSTMPLNITIETVPEGATVHTSSLGDSRSGPISLGITPCTNNIMIPQSDSVLLYFNKSGYEEGMYLLKSPFPEKITYNLKESYETLIRKEASQYSKEAIKQAFKITGTVDKAMSSPKMLLPQVVSEAESEYKMFLVDYPDFKDSSLGKCLKELIVESSLISVSVANPIKIGNRSVMMPIDSNLKKVNHYIQCIEKGLIM